MTSRFRRIPLVALVLAAGCSGKDGEIAVGTLERDRIELAAEAFEPLAAILVKEGDSVEAGQELARLDARRMDEERAVRQAHLAELKARLAELERGPRRELIVEKRAELKGLDSQVESARAELERIAALAEREFQSKSLLDVRRAEFAAAIAARDRTRAALDAMLSGATAEELQQAAAAVEGAEAALRETEVRLRRLRIEAPMAGVVDALPFEVGERPRQGEAVVVMLKGGAPYARVYVPSALRPSVAVGTAARIRVEGYDEAFQGVVRMVRSEAAFTPFFALTQYDRGRLSYLAEVDLTDEKARALPTGLPVEATFPAGQVGAAP